MKFGCNSVGGRFESATITFIAHPIFRFLILPAPTQFCDTWLTCGATLPREILITTFASFGDVLHINQWVFSDDFLNAFRPYCHM